MDSPKRIWLPLEMSWTRCDHCKDSGFEQPCYDHDFPDAIPYLRSDLIPWERIEHVLTILPPGSNHIELLLRDILKLKGDQ